jgi:hypothetical protein
MMMMMMVLCALRSVLKIVGCRSLRWRVLGFVRLNRIAVPDAGSKGSDCVGLGVSD